MIIETPLPSAPFRQYEQEKIGETVHQLESVSEF